MCVDSNGKVVFEVVGNEVDDPCFYRADSQEKAIRWLDSLLERTSDYSLMSELNDIQVECDQSSGCGIEVFPSKFSIPLKIVNLALFPYGLHIERREIRCTRNVDSEETC